jgi:hypothetical protein
MGVSLLEDEPIFRSAAQANGRLSPRSPMVIHHFASRATQRLYQRVEFGGKLHNKRHLLGKHRMPEGQGICRHDRRGEEDGRCDAQPEEERLAVPRDNFSAAEANPPSTESPNGSSAKKIQKRKNHDELKSAQHRRELSRPGAGANTR